MPGTPHTCSRADLEAGDTSGCYACQETHGHSTGRRPTVTEAPRPVDVRAVLDAAGIAHGAVEVRDAIGTPGAVLVRVRNARANSTARRVFAALDAADAYRLELPPASGVYLVHLAS